MKEKERKDIAEQEESDRAERIKIRERERTEIAVQGESDRAESTKRERI